MRKDVVEFLMSKTRVVGGGIFEMKIELGPGHRAYFAIRSRDVIAPLAGGGKSTQRADIRRAHALAKDD